MSQTMMDEYHLRLFVPDRIDPSEARAVRRVLNSRRFHLGLKRAVRQFFGRYPSLAKVSIRIVA